MITKALRHGGPEDTASQLREVAAQTTVYSEKAQSVAAQVAGAPMTRATWVDEARNAVHVVMFGR